VRVARHWHRLPREAEQLPSLEILKNCLHMALGQLPCPSRGFGPNDFHRSLPTSTIL